MSNGDFESLKDLTDAEIDKKLSGFRGILQEMGAE